MNTRTAFVISLVVAVVVLLGTAFSRLWAPKVEPVGKSGLQGGTIQLEAQRVERSNDAANSSMLPQPRGAYIVIDRYCNKLFLRTKDSVILDAMCSTGSGSELIDTASGRQWKFDTPSGVFKVESKLVNPWWRKPDWAYIEEGEQVPREEKLRYDDEMMGEYAIGFGDGYFIHGTIYERLLGRSVTHGCVRLGSKDLKQLYDKTKIGTLVYVF